jgi:hypothetical protein
MKNRFYITAAIALFALAAGCKKVEPPVYDDSHGVYIESGRNNLDRIDEELLDRSENKLNKDSLETSFVGREDQTITVWVRVMTKGRLDYANNRHFAAVAIDSLPTDKNFVQAVPEEYEFGEMVVEAGKTYGIMPITLKRSNRIMNDDAGVQLTVQLVPSADFPYVGDYKVVAGKPQNFLNFKVKWSNRIQMPETWISGQWNGNDYFGAWNPVKYLFILETLGDTTPDWATQAPSLGGSYTDAAKALSTVVKAAFAIYRDNNAKDPVAYPPLYNPNAAQPETWITFP